MLYRCFECGDFALDRDCRTCGDEFSYKSVPLDPIYYDEFQYRSKGLIKDFLGGRREKEELRTKLDKVLEKYKEFETPYFVNYVHLRAAEQNHEAQADASLDLRLFKSVLLRLGFDELRELPALLQKLVRSTSLRFLYSDFERRIRTHAHSNLHTMLKSWIAERGTAFRRELPLLLYYRWSAGMHHGLEFAAEPPLVPREGFAEVLERCEQIYFGFCVDRLKLTLEGFDSARFVTMFAIDAMDGYEFEAFLAELFQTLGYDVQTTKKGADQGADLFAERFGKKIVIQAKNYSANVGNAAVQQAMAAKTFYGCDQAMVVCNQSFTPSAKELAAAGGVQLVDRNTLQGHLDDYNRSILEQAEKGARAGSNDSNSIESP